MSLLPKEATVVDRGLFNPPQVKAADGVAPVHLNPTPGRLYLPGLETENEEIDDAHLRFVHSSTEIALAT